MRGSMMNLDSLSEGMQITLYAVGKAETISGVVSYVERKGRFIDGKPVRSRHVDSVTVKTDNGSDILIKRTDAHGYRLTTKQLV